MKTSSIGKFSSALGEIVENWTDNSAEEGWKSHILHRQTSA